MDICPSVHGDMKVGEALELMSAASTEELHERVLLS
jgi:hypothetical protein